MLCKQALVISYANILFVFIFTYNSTQMNNTKHDQSYTEVLILMESMKEKPFFRNIKVRVFYITINMPEFTRTCTL